MLPRRADDALVTASGGGEQCHPAFGAAALSAVLACRAVVKEFARANDCGQRTELTAVD